MKQQLFLGFALALFGMQNIVAAEYAGGNGTYESPYLIETPEQLDAIRNIKWADVKENPPYFRLENDLDLSGFENWTPLSMGNEDNTGGCYIHFDGNGHIIRNMHSAVDKYSSLFGILKGSCKNLGLVDVDVAATGSGAGAIAGAVEGGIKGGILWIVFACPIPMKQSALMVGLPLWEIALNNILPHILANFDKDGFTSWVQENIPQWQVREVLDVLTGNKIVTLITQHGLAEDLYYMVGFERDDDDGTYHARIDAWQKYFGYNWMYDFFFDYGTDMRYGKFSFEYEGENYIFWAWKGDYLNLGAGTELGIYKQYGDSDHYVVDISLPMTLKLEDENGEPIADYAPDEDQWWITGFNPYVLNPDASKLDATFEVDLSGNVDMYNAIKEQFKDKEEKNPEYKDWTYDDTNCKLTLHF